MKITDATVIVCSPGRNFVTLKLTTEDGITGVGDATVNGRELAVASYLQEHVCPLLIGRDARRIEDTWNYLYKGAYWRRGPITMAAISAVDVALWDIKGKAVGVPIYQLIGGQSRDGVLVYTHASGKSTDDVCAAVAEVQRRGFKAIRAQALVPGLTLNYGVRATQDPTDVSQRPLPLEEDWSSERYLNYVPKLFARLRKEFGDDLHLLHDVHHRLTPIEAARLGKDVEPYHLFWLEDPTPAEAQENLRLIRHHTTTPIAIGEIFNTVYDCHRLIEEQLIDYIRTTAVHAGGLTHQRKIAALAEVHQVRTACHGAQDMSPVCLAANLHFGLAVHNFGIQEYSPHVADTDRVFPHAYTCRDGYMHPGERPGLGIDIDEALAATFPYQRSYLPVNRKLDGTLHDW